MFALKNISRVSTLAVKLQANIEWVFRKWVSNNRICLRTNLRSKLAKVRTLRTLRRFSDCSRWRTKYAVPCGLSSWCQRRSLWTKSLCNLRWVLLYLTAFASRRFHILFRTHQMIGYMATFQLLGRYLRQISKPDLTTRDKQRLPKPRSQGL